MCCGSFLKIMMFIFNGAIFLAGAAILGVGVWVAVDSESLLKLLEKVDTNQSLSLLANVSYLLIGVGAVLLVIGFLGCCGAIRESKCMLLTFFCIVLIIFLVEVAGAVVLFVFQGFTESIFNSLEKDMKNIIQKDYGTDTTVTSVWNSTMDKLKCCGFRNYTDFEGSTFVSTGNLYPPTCCNPINPPPSCDITSAEAAKIHGCFESLVQLIKNNSVIIAGVAVGIAFIEIAAMVVSMVLYCKAGKA
ncbi:tetraspanin-1-like [Mugil cephalus]|uniref:tetraspanin-1-like n=1 Tax=Mugil cephalus TaxID=48193 RepID=UPI001FB775CE|nr:tetraspanin-1-like [Mugil cephalus]